MSKDANIVFIVIDALRPRNLGCYGYLKQTSPNIDSLAKKGVLFENLFACNNVTDSSVTTILSGKYPINHGIIGHGGRIQKEELRNINEITFLHEILKSYGYTTLAVDWLKRWHRRNYDVYYDTFPEKSHVGGAKHVRKYKTLKVVADVLRFFNMDRIVRKGRGTLGYGSEAGAVTDITIKLITKNLSNKFFIFIHYWDTHAICKPPKSYVKKFYRNAGGSDNKSIEKMLNQIKNKKRESLLRKHLRNAPNLNYVLALYDGAIAYVDHEIGRLMHTLNKHNLLDKTLIVLTSDHGESLTEHGIFLDHHGLYDVSLHVPLIVKGPGLPQGKRVESLVQHTDIAPTLLDILKIPISNEKMFDGKSLMPLIDGKKEELHSAIFAEEAYYERKRCIRTKRYKYIQALSEEEAMCRYCNRIHGGLEELYDLNKDPEETQNIVKKETETAKALRNRLHTWIKSFKQVKVKGGSYKPSPEEEKEVIERLRKLGYF